MQQKGVLFVLLQREVPMPRPTHLSAESAVSRYIARDEFGKVVSNWVGLGGKQATYVSAEDPRIRHWGVRGGSEPDLWLRIRILMEV